MKEKPQTDKSVDHDPMMNQIDKDNEAPDSAHTFSGWTRMTLCFYEPFFALF